MSVKYSKQDLANANDAAIANINNSPTPGYLEIRTGLPPATLEAPATGTLLSTCTLVDGTVGAFGPTATTTPLTAVGYTSSSVFAADPDIAANGTAGWFRLYDSAGNPRQQGDVATSAADLILDSVTFVQHGTVTISQYDLTIA